ncbi:MAG: CHASE3 domain-containing protein [Chthoniobacteraceae bacterium]
MKWNVGTKIGAGFTLVLVIFLLVGILSYQNILELKGAEEWQKHTYIVLRELDGIYSQLKSVESGQRGYVISGDDSDLEPYQTALGQIDGTLRDLRSLTADNPSQQQRLDSLEPKIKARLDVAAKGRGSSRHRWGGRGNAGHENHQYPWDDGWDSQHHPGDAE